MILYINEEHCSSLEQLKGYFDVSLTSDSTIYCDLLDYGRYGDISEWLQEMGEEDLAKEVSSIDNTLSDSEYFIALKKIITGVSASTSAKTLKPSFEKCFKFEGVEREFNGTSEIKVQVNLKVLLTVNERYEISVHSSWGSRGQMINPYDYQEGEVIKINIPFRKRPGKEYVVTSIKVDDKELPYKDETILPQRDKELLLLPSNANQLTNGEDSAQSFIETINGVSFKMIKVEGGTFKMGAQSTDPNGENYDSEARSDEGPVHSVKLDDYYIAETTVTQKMWEVVMGRNCSHPKSDNLPVNNVSWEDCQKFIAKLNSITGRCYSLPTEAQWEYAARGGNKRQGYMYSGGNILNNVAWNRCNTSSICRVGTKIPNELGLYNMSGNVREWCVDVYSTYKSGFQLNPQGASKGDNHVLRGGCYVDEAYSCRVSSRNYNNASRAILYYGFRLVCSAKNMINNSAQKLNSRSRDGFWW